MVFPLGTHRNSKGRLVIGGCDAVELTEEFGSPLYVYDESTLRANCRAYVDTLKGHYPNGSVAFAGKAYVDKEVLKIVAEEGLGLDAVSGGEIHCARAAEFPMERVTFHGNNKLREEIELALELSVGRFAVDGLDDLRLISEVASAKRRTARIILRLTPGIEAHTHEYIRTGAIDSKFGIAIQTGQAAQAVAAALSSPGIELLGYHAHIGSQIFDVAPIKDTVGALLDFAAEMEKRHGFYPAVISPGGGCGVKYLEDDDAPAIPELVEAVCSAMKARLPAGRRPELALEPGRSIVAPAGVALYAVGAIKEIPGVRIYAAVDGGMADNIRPALYGARYTVVLASRDDDSEKHAVTVAGRYCESGDILFKDVQLPRLRRGDVLASATSGAYNFAMSSNYNMSLRPAVVIVKEGMVRLSRRRETYDDLLATLA